MRKVMKILLVIAACLIILGGALFALSMLNAEEYENNTHIVSQTFENVTINTDTADITFALSEDGTCKVVCHEPVKAKHAVTVQDDTLTVNQVNEKKWYDYIGISFDSPKITVYLPDAAYETLVIKDHTGDIRIPKGIRFERMEICATTGNVNTGASVPEVIKITTSTGNIHVENVSAGGLELSVTTGKITVSDASCAADVKLYVSTGKTELTNVKCRNLLSEGDTGDLSMKNVVATGKLTVERSTGDVKLTGCDAAELLIETDTGDVTGSLLTDKVFVTKTATGRVNVPETTSGGKCKIKTDTGDIHITIGK